LQLKRVRAGVTGVKRAAPLVTVRARSSRRPDVLSLCAMPTMPPPGPLTLHRPRVWLKESWLRFSAITLQTRMTVIALEAGLLLHSPSPATLSVEARRELEALGMPRYLVAPNEIHNVGLPAFQRAYPDAHTTGCVGHPKRVRDVRFDALLDGSATDRDVPWTRSGELALHVIRGNELLHEMALYHRPTRTLILTDAIELIEPEAHISTKTLPARLMLRMMSSMGFTLGRACMSPEHHVFCRDPGALRASLEAIEAWDFDSVIMAHGRLLEGDLARQAVRRGFESTIEAATRRSAPARAMWSLVARLEA
jgi:hypothetical protein